MTHKIKKRIEFGGELSLQASATEDKPAKLKLLANTGKPMRLPGHEYPVIVEMDGASFAKDSTPIIVDHDPSRRVGHTSSQEIANGNISANGLVSSKSKDAVEVLTELQAGFPYQVSIGADIVEGIFLEEGHRAEVNNEIWEGPLIISAKTVIHELSVTVLGADRDTSATIAASSSSKESETDMEFKDYVASLGFDVKDLNDDQKTKIKAKHDEYLAIKAAAVKPAEKPKKVETPDTIQARRDIEAAEEERVDSIKAMVKQFDHLTEVELEDGSKIKLPSLKAKAIKKGWTAEKVELLCMRSEVPAAPAVHVATPSAELGNRAIAAAAIRQFGLAKNSATHKETGEKYGLEHWYDDKVLEASDHKDLRNLSLHSLMDMQIRAAGNHHSGSRKSDEFIRLAQDSILKIRAAGTTGFDTLDITNIFDDVMHKGMLAAYNAANTTWQEIAGTANVNDFKTHNMYRLGMKGAYEQVGPDGELKHTGFIDEKYQHSADTYGRIVGLTRHHLINDDMNALGRVATMLGMEAAKTLEESVYVHLLTNKGTIYTAGQGNYADGAGTDLSISSLGQAAQLFEDQTYDNAPLMLEADRILVGTQDRVEASQLFNDSEVREGRGQSKTSPQSTRNPHVGAYRPIVSPYLNNTSVLQRMGNAGSAIPGQTSDQWFMFVNPSNPMGSTLIVSLLNGKRTPTIEQADAAFNVLGLQWRAYHDFGVDTGDPKLSVHMKGAA